MTNTDAETRQYRAAYYAAVSWADEAAGQVLAELERLGLSNDTLVVMHADHGWHLGEYNMVSGAVRGGGENVCVCGCGCVCVRGGVG